jgi:1,4-alpha-glucan branching enzyme
LIFNYGRNEVRNFLVASALFWLDEFHIDGLRVDAVASMLYLDYSRKDGEWVPNHDGGRENWEAVRLLQETTTLAYRDFPGVMMIAEESTAWNGVTRRADEGGLGFGFKWNMGWMHDTLEYLGHEAIHRQHHHGEITFSILYAWSENFILPLSHDEVVHGKGSMVNKFPGDRWQKMATLRALYGYMWAHPGKQLLFMGDEFAQNDEWSESRSLDWHLTDYAEHAQVQSTVARLNEIYRERSELWQCDTSSAGFQWLIGDDASGNTLAFARFNDAGEVIIVATNFSAVPHLHYRIPLPRSSQGSMARKWREIFNSDRAEFGGSDLKNDSEIVVSENSTMIEVVLPPLATIWIAPSVKS